MQELNALLEIVDGYIGGSQWFVFLLLLTGLFFTIYLKFPQLRYFGHALRIVRGKYDRAGDEGDTSHFQALATALSGTVGTGNIAGVALAIHLGGPAAIFWMIVTAFLGMTTKFVEVTLSHKYRDKAEDGTIAGGPMYYMKKRLNIKTASGKTINTGVWLGGIFAVATILSSFGTGSLPQVNSIANSMFTTFGIKHIITGGVLSVILAFVILGGIKRIAQVTEKLVPAMAVIYFVGAISVIIYNFGNIPSALAEVFADLFTGSAATGGFLGATIAYAFNRGVNRGLFSNEAGQGSAPIAHASAKAHEPVSEGIVAILEPFIDTIIICSLTGLTLLSSGVWKEKIENQFQNADLQILADLYDDQREEDRKKLAAHLLDRDVTLPLFSGDLTVVEGIVQDPVTFFHARSLAEEVRVSLNGRPYNGRVSVQNGVVSAALPLVLTGKSLIHSAPLTAEAFKRSYFGDFGQYIISIGLLLFAFSTAISWSYYGGRAMTYLFGVKSVLWYRSVYVLGFFLASFTDTTIIWTLSGITIALMTIPNLIGILLLHKEMKRTVAEYWEQFWIEHPKDK